VKALVDGDLVVFRVSASVKEEDQFDIVIERIDNLLTQIFYNTDAEEHQIYLTGTGNFRKKVNKEYKANRKDSVPPPYLQDARKYLVDKYGAIISQGCEADDLLGINQTEETVICSLDKDLMMIPGRHFSWQIGTQTWTKPAKHTTVTQQDGLRFFYKQLLIGDSTDNIIGVQGIGTKTADKLIEHLDDEQDMLNVVLEKYKYDFNRFVMNCQCLWIQRKENEFWTTQMLNQKKDLISSDQSLLDAVQKYDSMTSS
jgi:5'-3' exonuclease